jgi:hypothetical protein
LACRYVMQMSEAGGTAPSVNLREAFSSLLPLTLGSETLRKIGRLS